MTAVSPVKTALKSLAQETATTEDAASTVSACAMTASQVQTALKSPAPTTAAIAGGV